MPTALVDTDVVSFYFRNDTRAALYDPHLTGRILAISFMTLAELHRWAIGRNWGAARRAALDAYIGQFVLLPWDAALCLKWAEISVESARRGHVLAHADAWQAATALLLDIPLVSHNRRDFAGLPGLTLVSEAPG
jgi:tRNA(fMet)-specific endonuclease VapC